MLTRQRTMAWPEKTPLDAVGTDVIPLRPGLKIHLTSVPAATVVKTHFSINDSPIIFGFMLAGVNRCHYADGTLRNTTIIHQSGSNRISYLPETTGHMECTQGMLRLSILTSQDFLEPYLSLETAKMPQTFARALAGKQTTFQWTGQYHTQKMRLVSEMFTTSYCGALRRLHLEIQALELIRLQLAEYLAPVTCLSSVNLSAAEIRCIKNAREILIMDLENPPSLGELAKQAGINEKKLKQGFKQVFGMPIFTYFRNYRLEIAKDMLASGAWNVTQAGMHIGYKNLSHFSAEFRKKYGVTPKKFSANNN